MSKILLLHPNKWGRGITSIWIASHAGVLRRKGHEVLLFDCTFYEDWTENENKLNTINQQYRKTDYEKHIKWNKNKVRNDLISCIKKFNPEIIFFSAISSHIHGEGEYVSIQYAYNLLNGIKKDALLVAGGLQATADPEGTLNRFPNIDLLIRGESELVLADIADSFNKKFDPSKIKGVCFKKDGMFTFTGCQAIISAMDNISPYDYSIFDKQVFLRPYNGKLLNAVDYELSRGCPFSCGYCVETVIQKYYGFISCNQRGCIKNFRSYLRSKSAKMAFDELKTLHDCYGVTLIRSQDTNFLTISPPVLEGLAKLFDDNDLPVIFYIETRPEGINERNIALLKRLHVDGIGMGIELSSEDFRENRLNRYSDQGRIINAFNILKRNKIKRTAYNVIGFPLQDEKSIIDTIKFNRLLEPDNVTVAFYSPYLGTKQQKEGSQKKYFLDYEFNLDAQLRTMTRHSKVSSEVLKYYKRNFARLVRSDEKLKPLG